MVQHDNQDGRSFGANVKFVEELAMELLLDHPDQTKVENLCRKLGIPASNEYLDCVEYLLDLIDEDLKIKVSKNAIGRTSETSHNFGPSDSKKEALGLNILQKETHGQNI